jgi:ATP-binding cassette subfamily F protein uup
MKKSRLYAETALFFTKLKKREEMGLIWINNVTVSFGGPLLLDSVSLQIEEGERIGLLGRNGSGKSTLLKMLSGEIPADQGEIIQNNEVRIAMLSQDVPDNLPGTVYDVVASGGRDHLDILKHYHDLAIQVARKNDVSLLKKLQGVQHQLETTGAWNFHLQVEMVLSRTGLNEDTEFNFLSAGMKRRVLLARALVNDPDLLLLDEPTNHLDINAIIWLEDFLLKFEKTVMFVTHDRAFLQKIATRIVEIDRGSLFSFSCDYGKYLDRRQAMLVAEEKQWHDFGKKLSKEEAWVRQGVKARRTRNEGRVRALQQLRQERASRREQAGVARIAIQEACRSGKLVVNAEKISFAFGENKIIENFSTTIIRGDKIGIIGPNGSGKTTLLKVLLGELQPRSGKFRLGTGIQVAYFDQLRARFDENKTLKDNIADGNDTVIIDGAPRHIVGYLQGFLFPPAQILASVKSLSGGERNRLLLAKLFSTPSNLLVLDEPTNDLDTETLELLEARLLEYSGTILMVSHDRAFLNNVVTSTIVLEGDGILQEYIGGYDDWLRQRTTANDPFSAVPNDEKPRKGKSVAGKRKLTYKETREREGLPRKIEILEAEKQQLITKINSPEFYAQSNTAQVIKVNERLESLESELDCAYQRWHELEELAAGNAR